MSTPLSLGEVLRAAREKQRLTASEVAEATRIKVQVIQRMEADDFSRIAAPIYAKGFIRLYAERVGLDPEPLIEAYVRTHAHPVRPTLESPLPPAPAAAARRAPELALAERAARMLAALGEVFRDLASRAAGVARRVRLPGRPALRRFRRPSASLRVPWRTVGYVAAGVAALALLVWAVSGLAVAVRRAREKAPPPNVVTARRAPARDEPLRVALEPAAPYVAPAGKGR